MYFWFSSTKVHVCPWYNIVISCHMCRNSWFYYGAISKRYRTCPKSMETCLKTWYFQWPVFKTIVISENVQRIHDFTIVTMSRIPYHCGKPKNRCYHGTVSVCAGQMPHLWCIFLILCISVMSSVLKQEPSETKPLTECQCFRRPAFKYTHPEEGTRFLIHVKQRKAVPCNKRKHSVLLSILHVLHIHEHSPEKMSARLLWLGLLHISLSALCKDTPDRFRPSHPLFIHLSHLFFTFALICRACGRHTAR